MGRTVRASRKKDPALRPVQKVEVPHKHVKARLIAAAVFLVIGAAALGIALSTFTSVPDGWQEITASTVEDSCAGDFQLLYRLGASGRSARSENRDLVSVYTKACQDAYRIFNAGEEFSGGLASLNLHPNQPVTLDPALYAALELIADSGDRRIFLGPAYEIYDGIFSCTEDWQTADFDPLQDPELRRLFGLIAGFASDPGSVDIRLLGGGQAELVLSEEYMSLAREQELTRFVDLYYLKNAFIADLLAQRLTDAGFTLGAISSYDGFVRTLESGETYGLNLPDNSLGQTVVAATLDYTGPMALASFKSFPAGENDGWYYRPMADGTVRHRYLSLADGLPGETSGPVTVYSPTLGCGQLALMGLGVFLDGEDLSALTDAEGILIEDETITRTDPSATLSGIFAGYTEG